MKNSTIKVNSKTFEKIKEQIPTTKNPLNLMSYAMNLMNSIKIKIDDELEDGVFILEQEEIK